jgi:hypothetical protein
VYGEAEIYMHLIVCLFTCVCVGCDHVTSITVKTVMAAPLPSATLSAYCFPTSSWSNES